mmetsp:Transcript_12010/g.20275  ORF Transcript_12010/g.20275 Transcript_12010/m.20275 type:complete len:83 (-) Transcript_12010:58-306(-)
MNALVYFGQIEQSTYLHELTQRLINAQHVCQKSLFTVEQQRLMSEQPDLQEYYFPDQLGTQKLEETSKQEVADWENQKFFKH